MKEETVKKIKELLDRNKEHNFTFVYIDNEQSEEVLQLYEKYERLKEAAEKSFQNLLDSGLNNDFDVLKQLGVLRAGLTP
jgi:flavoprotein